MQSQEFEESQSSIYNAFEERINLKKWDEDEGEIRNFLKKLTTDIEQSFLQTRLEKGVKEDEIQYEFELAVKEILNKEQQIKLSLELAYVLLEKMHEQRDIFSEEFDDFQQQKEVLQRELDFKEQYCEEYSRRLQFLTEQNNNITKEYVELEEFNEKLKARNSELDQELIKSVQQMELVKQNKEQDTNSKLLIIQRELDNLKNHNMQLSKDLSETKKKLQQEQIQNHELLNLLEEQRRNNCLLSKEGDILKRQVQEQSFRVSAIQDEKEKVEVQLMQLQIFNQKSLMRKDSKESDIQENDSYIAQAHINNANILNENEKNQGQFSALYGEILGFNKNQPNKIGDDMFNYYSSNRDSHTEDNTKDHNNNIKGKAKGISKNKLTKRFGKRSSLSEIQNENRSIRNQTLQGQSASQIIIENMYEGGQEIINKKRSETQNYFKKGINNQLKVYQEEGDFDEYDSDFQIRNVQDEVIDDSSRSYLNFKKQIKPFSNKNEGAMKIEDQNYSSIDDNSLQVDLKSYQDQKLEELQQQNSYEEMQINSYQQEVSPLKEKQISLVNDHRIQEEEEHHEEEKDIGRIVEDSNEDESKQSTQQIIQQNQGQSESQTKCNAEQNNNNKKIQGDQNIQETDNNNPNNSLIRQNIIDSDLKSHKKLSGSKGVQFNFNSTTKQYEKSDREIATPSETGDNKKDQEIIQQQQNNSQKQLSINRKRSDSISKYQNNHFNTQPQIAIDDYSNASKTSLSSQVRKYSSRNQTHRKTRFMESMKSYKITHWGDDNDDNNKQNTMTTNDTFNQNTRKYRHEHTRSLLIPSEISDLQKSEISQSQEGQGDKKQLNTKNDALKISNNPFDKVVIDGNALLFEQQSFSPTKILSQRQNLYKMQRLGIKSASISTFPTKSAQQMELQYDINQQEPNQENNQLEDRDIVKETFNYQIRESEPENLDVYELEQDIIVNRKDILNVQDSNQLQMDKDEGSEIMNKSKEVQTYEMNKIHSINGDEIDRQNLSPLQKDIYGSKDENGQFSNIIQSLQNGLKHQSVNPEYENISEMLINNQRNRSKDRSIDRNFFRSGTCKNEKQQRKDPYEEFFMLTAQCVKLNSPYFDEIYSVNVQPFFEEVKAKSIPYHKEYLNEELAKIHQNMQEQNKIKYTYKVRMDSNRQSRGPQLQLCSIIQKSVSPQKRK